MSIPRIPPRDVTLPLLADPYRFVSKESARLGSDAFETRLLCRGTTCLKGEKGAALFYDAERFRREGAMPSPIRKTLLGEGGVQGLDGEAHRHRKAIFMGLTQADRVRALGARVEAEWIEAAERWLRAGATIRLYDELATMLTRAVCAWSETPLPEADVQLRAGHLRALFDAAGARNPRHFWSRHARRRVDHWLKGVIEDVREGRHRPAENTATFALAHARDPGGTPLAAEVAAVELANILRPTVATAVYVVFLAHALHTQPEAARAATQSLAARDAFIEEIRRFYPFFPSLVATTRRDFVWEGLSFPEGRQVILDLYGTNHDANAWPDPEIFRPARFANRPPGAFDFVPQGGGDHLTGHRCPGEGIVHEILMRSFDVLTTRLRYEVPKQDLRLNLRRLPALPRSGFFLRPLDLARSG
ncbi:cytochrome P450 [Brevundimonas staleyi]|uniref:Cytochrome P450 n=1 Tax=Brevundimonas staleyi TaxID=74326 RepID=A0ABW0FQL9_9CAUL|nr:cytochrome P450 [Brevundimonas diminuta]MDM8353462.1 cytochrome P450 [Brevundimonas diminuta]